MQEIGNYQEGHFYLLAVGRFINGIYTGRNCLHPLNLRSFAPIVESPLISE